MTTRTSVVPNLFKNSKLPVVQTAPFISAMNSVKTKIIGQDLGSLEIAQRLANALSRYHITFTSGYGESGNPEQAKHYLSRASIDENGGIDIEYENEFYQQFDDMADYEWNSFVQTVAALIAHELTHRNQMESIKDTATNVDKAIRTLGGDPARTAQYLGNPHEVAAFAREAVEELRNLQYTDERILQILSTADLKDAAGDSHTLWTYWDFFGSGDPVFKRFLQQMYKIVTHKESAEKTAGPQGEGQTQHTNHQQDNITKTDPSKPFEDKEAKTGPHKNCCVMADIPGSAAAQILQAGLIIPDEELGVDGREDDPHITIKFGAADDEALLATTLKGVTPFSVTLGKLKVFIPSESSGHQAPVVAECHAPELKQLHDLIDKAMSVRKDDFPYSPHVTLAFVKPELAQKYEGSDICSGITFRVDSLTLSRKGGERTTIPFPKHAAHKFIKEPRSQRDVLVAVDPQRLDEAWKNDTGFYIGPGGVGQISARYPRFQQWLKDNPNTPIEAPIVSWNVHSNAPSFTNGRHRFSVLRDMGAKKIYIAVPADQVDIFKKFAARKLREDTWEYPDSDFTSVNQNPDSTVTLTPINDDGWLLPTGLFEPAYDGSHAATINQMGYAAYSDAFGDGLVRVYARGNGVHFDTTTPYEQVHGLLEAAMKRSPGVTGGTANIGSGSTYGEYDWNSKAKRFEKRKPRREFASHKTPPMSDTQYRDQPGVDGEGTQAWSNIPERVKGTYEDFPLEELNPTLFKQASMYCCACQSGECLRHDPIRAKLAATYQNKPTLLDLGGGYWLSYAQHPLETDSNTWTVLNDTDKLFAVGEVTLDFYPDLPAPSIRNIRLNDKHQQMGLGPKIIQALSKFYDGLTSDPQRNTNENAKKMWRRIPGVQEVPSPKSMLSPPGNYFVLQASSDISIKASQDLNSIRANGPIDVTVWRVGPLQDNFGRGIYFGGTREDAAAYSFNHSDAEPLAYEVKAKSAYVTRNQASLLQELFNKGWGDEVARVDATKFNYGNSMMAARTVEARMVKELKKRGFDALVYTNPMPPAKLELATFGSTVKVTPIEAKTAATAPPFSLKDSLEALRPQMAAVAQTIYESWEEDETGGGICDEISQELMGVIVGHIADVDVTEGGQDGDDHAWVIAFRGKEVYGVDIPPSVYETGGGYSWEKIPDVTFTPDNVEIWKLDIDPKEFSMEGSKTAAALPTKFKKKYSWQPAGAISQKQIETGSYFLLSDGSTVGNKISEGDHNFLAGDIMGIDSGNAVPQFCQKYEAIRIAAPGSYQFFSPPTSQQWRQLARITQMGDGGTSFDTAGGVREDSGRTLTFGELMRRVNESYGIKNAALKTSATFYHGTTSDVLPKIEKEGLVPGMGGEIGEGSRTDAIYLTSNFRFAEDFEKHKSQFTGGAPVVLEVFIPDSMKRELEIDPEDPNGLMFDAKIPATWIKVAAVPTELYHGTSATALESVRREGLRTDAEIYLSNDYDEALAYAQRAAKVWKDETCAVVTVDISKLDQKDPRYQLHEVTSDVGIFWVGQVPVSAILRIETVKIAATRDRWQYGGCWRLAYQIHQLLPGSKYVAVGPNEQKQKNFEVNHVAVMDSQGRIWDSKGARTPEQFLGEYDIKLDDPDWQIRDVSDYEVQIHQQPKDHWMNENFSDAEAVAKKILKKGSIQKIAFKIEVPKSVRDHFWQEPPEGNWEFWAFRHHPGALPGEKIVFTFDHASVATAVVHHIEEPGKTKCENTGKYESHHKVYWEPQTFRRIDGK